LERMVHMRSRHLSIDDLPRFSDWPARLLGISDFRQREKNRDEILREYEIESWGRYLRRVQDQKLERDLTTETLDDWQCPANKKILYTDRELFIESEFCDAYHRYLDVIYSHLESAGRASAVVELGCGYGSVLLPFAKKGVSRQGRFIAGEYTPSGRALTSMCAKNMGVDVEVGHCDFTGDVTTNLEIPPDSIIFTTISACLIAELPEQFFYNLISMRPKIVYHFEPIYEHYRGNSLLDLMRRRYVEVNGYSRQFLPALRKHAADGRLRLVIEDAAVIGLNPLFPISVVAWDLECG
jgi:hypothetical protein